MDRKKGALEFRSSKKDILKTKIWTDTRGVDVLEQVWVANSHKKVWELITFEILMFLNSPLRMHLPGLFKEF